MPLFVSAYDDHTTHPALTQEIVKFFHFKFQDLKIPEADAEYIVKGSENEDAFGRWMRHYYDPVHNRGLSYLGTQWQSSKEWAKDTIAQATYKIQDLPERTLYGSLKDLFSGETDFSWDRAIYEYVWGDKKRGLTALGHILHLIEDASVPDHVRNDPHPAFGKRISGIAPSFFAAFLEHHDDFNASPYESFAVFDRKSVNIAEKIKHEQPLTLPSIDEYFERMAGYSNNNFFSEDTILSRDYREPTTAFYKKNKLSNGLTYNFAYSRGGQILFRKDEDLLWQTDVPLLTLKDYDKIILTSYWSLLSKQAVLHGAGVVKLFFDEVKKERKTKTLYEKNRSWLGKRVDNFKRGMFGMAGVLYGSSVALEDLEDDVAEPNFASVAAAQSKETPIVTSIPTLSPLRTPSIIIPLPPPPRVGSSLLRPTSTPTPISAPLVSPTPSPPPALRPAATSKDTSSNVPIAGGGGPSVVVSTSTPPDTAPPNPPVIASPGQDNQTFATTTITSSGTAEASSIISNNISSTTAIADSAGNWSLAVDALLQGTTTIQFFAKDAAGNQSAAANRTVFIDSVSPDLSLTISECGQSFSPELCVIATTTVSISWSTSATDIAYYELNCTQNGIACQPSLISTTTATSTTYTIPIDFSRYQFSAKAIDAAGNQSSVQTKTIEVATRPIIINEVAWAGTSASRTEDEWIELKNNTSQTISFDDSWVLRSETDGAPYLTLSGAIAPYGFYLIERKNSGEQNEATESSVIDITADLWKSFGNGLNNNGEVLALARASTTIDTVALCNGAWCGGEASPLYYSMERSDPLASGDASSNWGTWGGFLTNGKNADNAAISGTPGRRNSINYLIIKDSNALNENKTLSASSSPYIITSAFTVASGKTLTVPAGVIIKFSAGAGLTANGAIDARGTAADPVVFTSLKDDSYAGDTNQDATTTAPAAGDWTAIKLLAQGSVFDRAVIRYGGTEDIGGGYWANIRLENASTTITNSTIEYSKTYGIFVRDTAGGSIESNIIRYHNRNISGQTKGVGVVLSNSSPAIRNNQFTQNTRGLIIETGSGSAISGNTFSQQIDEIATINVAYPVFSGSTADQNGINGLLLEGTMQQDYAFSADLPYVVRSTYGVASGKTLTIPAGAIVKLQTPGNFSLSGKLTAQGSAASKIVFTSIHDDGCGATPACGDTNNNGTSTSPQAGDWDNLTFLSGAASSTLSHARVRYGGIKAPLDSNRGAVRTKNTSIEIRNSILEKNYIYGIWMENATSTLIADSTIRDHQDPLTEPVYGISLTASSTPLVKNTVFQNNRTGHVQTDGTSAYVNGGGNTFD